MQSKIKNLNLDTKIFISEWNKSGNPKEFADFNSENIAIAFTGSKLIDFLNQGIYSATYFSIKENIPVSKLPERKTYGIYKKQGASKIIFPQIKTWQVLSNELGLGSSQSIVYRSEATTDINAVGFKNSTGNSGFAISNLGDSKTVSISIKNLDHGNKGLEVSVFEASNSEDGILPKCNEIIDTSEEELNLKLMIPDNSVIGVIFSQPNPVIKSISKLLTRSSYRSCIHKKI
jgi:hypothetical protein